MGRLVAREILSREQPYRRGVSIGVSNLPTLA